MICKPCKNGDHKMCSSILIDRNPIPTGLSEAGDKVQRSGLCDCQHRVTLLKQLGR